MPNKDDSQQIIIKKSNELIEARYRLSIAEQRLILLLASQIRKDDKDFNSYEIRVSDFAEMFELKTEKSLYERVEQASAELLGKKLYLKNDRKNFEATVWLSYVKYVRGSGVIQLRFDDSLKPYLLQLKDSLKGFTQYKLGAVMNFKSSYSVRLYELLKKEVWIAEKEGRKDFKKTFEIEEYRLLLGIDKKAYPLFADFRRWTIEPPVKEITEQTDLEIFETRYIKTGRKITGVCFVVLIKDEKQKAKQEKQEAQEQKQEIHRSIQALMDNGFSFENAKSYKTKYGVKQIERNLAYMQAEERNGKKIDNRPAYLAKAIQEDWGQYHEAEMKAKAEKERKRREQEEQRQREQTTLDEQIAMNYQRAFSVYQELGNEEEKEKLKLEFMEMADSFTLGKIKEAEKKKEDPFSSTIARVTFTKFLIGKGF